MSQQACIVVRHDIAVVVGPTVDAEVRAQVVQVVTGGRGLDGLLDLMASLGRARIPSFGCAVAEDRATRVLVRGDISVSVAGGEEFVANPDLSTWREELVLGRNFSFVTNGSEVLHWQRSDATTADVVSSDGGPDGSASSADQRPPARAPASTSEASGPSDLIVGVPDVLRANRADVADTGESGSPEALASRTVGAVDAVDDRTVMPRQPSAPVAENDSSPPAPVRPAAPAASGSVPAAAPSWPADSPVNAMAPGATASTADDASDRTVIRGVSAGSATRGDALPAPPSDLLGGIRFVRCQAGHPSPVHAEHCRTCSQPVIDTTVHVATSLVIARLVFDDGTIIELDRPQIIGRSPTVSADSHLGDLVGLHAIPDPEHQLSRSHLEVALDDWSITVTDLGSINGTWLTNPGKEPVRLRPNTPYMVVLGAQVQLSDIARFVVETPQ